MYYTLSLRQIKLAEKYIVSKKSTLLLLKPDLKLKLYEMKKDKGPENDYDL